MDRAPNASARTVAEISGTEIEEVKEIEARVEQENTEEWRNLSSKLERVLWSLLLTDVTVVHGNREIITDKATSINTLIHEVNDDAEMKFMRQNLFTVIAPP